MQFERRALYNLMRMNWILDPNMAVEPWQVDDYRSMSLEDIFERLKAHEMSLDRISFVDLAYHVDSPEDMTEELLADTEADTVTHDQVYLLVFELWRRLLQEKPCLSIFCDELDHQIHKFDTGETEHPEAIQDAIANLQVVLNENTDNGADPHDVFESVCSGCANDVESFLYDYITEQIETDNIMYASDLIDGFIDYVHDYKWFDFLRTRLIAHADQEAANEMIPALIQDAIDSPDLEFSLELLAFLVQGGDRAVFTGVVRRAIPLLKTEEDFQDLLGICADYFRRLDSEPEEQAIQKLIRRRTHLHAEGVFGSKDPHIQELLTILD